jgi:hypothetical protein
MTQELNRIQRAVDHLAELLNGTNRTTEIESAKAMFTSAVLLNKRVEFEIEVHITTYENGTFWGWKEVNLVKTIKFDTADFIEIVCI